MLLVSGKGPLDKFAIECCGGCRCPGRAKWDDHFSGMAIQVAALVGGDGLFDFSSRVAYNLVQFLTLTLTGFRHDSNHL